MEKRIAVMKVLSRTEWGCREKTLRNTYVALARSVAEYAATAWRPYIGKGLAEDLEKKNRKAATVITGCHDGTNAKSLMAEAQLGTLELRAVMLQVIARERYRRLGEGVPARELLGGMKGLTPEEEEMRRTVMLDRAPAEAFPRARMQPWGEGARVKFRYTENVGAQRSVNPETRRAAWEKDLR